MPVENGDSNEIVDYNTNKAKEIARYMRDSEVLLHLSSNSTKEVYEAMEASRWSSVIFDASVRPEEMEEALRRLSP